MLEIKQILVSSAKYSIKAPYKLIPEYITVHNTANDAPAVNEARYHNSNNNQVSFHYAVDDKEIIQVVPTDRNAWHCGDGNGNGNRKSIGVEICYSKSGGERYDKAENNAVELVAYLLMKHGLGIDKVRKHQDWSGKYCPHRILDRGTWKDFLNRVEKALNKLKGKGEANTPPANNELYRIKSGTFNTKLEAKNAKAKVAKNKLANIDYITIHEDKGKFYFQTGTYVNETTANQYLQKMKDLKIIWVGTILKA
ncbi:N-acetylmuramoyl-L-alanine amidase family protein [Lysinibacillus sp. NPDC086135]|uniref:peptidoglycan recognition protein family protein n=1 Tax=Lysinibacillus sp. NPDC086135 TaxID=3364130 RepID=UPI00382421BF